MPDLKAKQISADVNSTIIIDLDNNVWGFGSNKDGQLGLGDNQDRSIPTQVPNFKAQQVSVGNYHSVAIDLEDNVWVTGSNDLGQLGLIGISNVNKFVWLPNFKARQVSAWYGYTTMIDLENNVWVFGNNNFGVLGLNVQNDTIIPILTQIPNFKARQISAASTQTIAIDLDNNGDR